MESKDETSAMIENKRVRRIDSEMPTLTFIPGHMDPRASFMNGIQSGLQMPEITFSTSWDSHSLMTTVNPAAGLLFSPEGESINQFFGSNANDGALESAIREIREDRAKQKAESGMLMDMHRMEKEGVINNMNNMNNMYVHNISNIHINRNDFHNHNPNSTNNTNNANDHDDNNELDQADGQKSRDPKRRIQNREASARFRARAKARGQELKDLRENVARLERENAGLKMELEAMRGGCGSRRGGTPRLGSSPRPRSPRTGSPRSPKSFSSKTFQPKPGSPKACSPKAGSSRPCASFSPQFVRPQASDTPVKGASEELVQSIQEKTMDWILSRFKLKRKLHLRTMVVVVGKTMDLYHTVVDRHSHPQADDHRLPSQNMDLDIKLLERLEAPQCVPKRMNPRTGSWDTTQTSHAPSPLNPLVRMRSISDNHAQPFPKGVRFAPQPEPTDVQVLDCDMGLGPEPLPPPVKVKPASSSGTGIPLRMSTAREFLNRGDEQLLSAMKFEEDSPSRCRSSPFG
mmetsp:Transcript_47974/g.91689  ORF Transcript_47974/g.91689 Transcript_47974/m.91689 type:complete len:517 (-) Transcript_47974:178-1728(-)|eukprot:CAMPEP_0114235176 /NCGR_PEP_ID=MMETSP0058-20121206/6106_1 /TAXON_ID=36894 /ORGANISM="Pyramimonas parkeae, CCMP726" /LENGTH=516 /DNA_ID=CAMNT_0001346911 /DNA_START=631 /DNA_END=2181 /DNA_ORIENTATION=+